jgi:hypothetical protein
MGIRGWKDEGGRELALNSTVRLSPPQPQSPNVGAVRVEMK